MKFIITTLAASSIIFVGGCNKTKKATINNAVSQPITTDDAVDTGAIEMEFTVEVESDGEDIVLTINGEEQVIDLGDSFDLRELPNHIMQQMNNGETMNPHMDGMWVLGMAGHEDHDWMRENPMMRMMGGEDHEEMMRMHDQMIEMMGDREMPEEMREMHERMMHMHERQERRSDRMHDDRQFHDIPEEHEFMQELGMMNEVSYHLSEPGAISMLGIHMIRDELEPEERLGALERIIEDASQSSPARNAALIVAIETLQELSREEEAADLMVELVLSNAHWDDDD